MEQFSMWIIFLSFLLHLNTSNCVEDEVSSTLINFLAKLSNNDGSQNSNLVWKPGSHPCKDLWQGVVCNEKNASVQKLFLNRSNLAGTLDVAMLCNSRPIVMSLTSLNLDGNKVSGGIANEVGNCKHLTHLNVSGNQLHGILPSSLAMLSYLKELDISNNKFSGNLPNLSRISGLNTFLAQNNQLTGEIPPFNFSKFDYFNVSFNDLSGRVPYLQSHFTEDSFLGNPELCGNPLPNNCSSLPTSDAKLSDSEESKGPSKSQILMYSGYAAMCLVFILFVVLALCKRNKTGNKVEAEKEAIDDSTIDKPSHVSNEYKLGVSRSEFSVTSESAMASRSFAVLSKSYENDITLEGLMRSPAELIGRGKFGSLYKVLLDNGMMVVVKRIKDLTISSHDFKQRMHLLNQVKHHSLLLPLAFYCSQQEKLLLYEYQENGSLFKILHGSSKDFDWTSRLGIAAAIAESLAFMHQELEQHGIAHGNLKSSNILLNKNMEPCISEYGVMVMDDQEIKIQQSSSFASSFAAGASDAFKGDVYGFGVILLELLTGKLVKSNGMDLTEWVESVVREEWTGEVFDRTLISEYVSEERMVSLLQVAIRCINQSPEARPSMNQVALMINVIKEEEEKSLIYEAL
ncbi:probable inactive receptor kinase At2g26730 [Prosopis cineraria]|uniref:probable inactive receptor kinase At2g26730 n=1 Tax=Prosopis cineraria TaxID=364024 RepID=UPI0024108BA4|nr:probable inactive receptor kinase At2g26730 [Prosopis cineraria]